MRKYYILIFLFKYFIRKIDKKLNISSNNRNNTFNGKNINEKKKKIKFNESKNKVSSLY